MIHYLSQDGGGNCSLCGSPGTNKTTCPLNEDPKSIPRHNYATHPKAADRKPPPQVPLRSVPIPASPPPRPSRAASPPPRPARAASPPRPRPRSGFLPPGSPIIRPAAARLNPNLVQHTVVNPDGVISAGAYYRKHKEVSNPIGDVCDIRGDGKLKCLIMKSNGVVQWVPGSSDERCYPWDDSRCKEEVGRLRR
jgi:hypothetical protein